MIRDSETFYVYRHHAGRWKLSDTTSDDTLARHMFAVRMGGTKDPVALMRGDDLVAIRGVGNGVPQ